MADEATVEVAAVHKAKASGDRGHRVLASEQPVGGNADARAHAELVEGDPHGALEHQVEPGSAEPTRLGCFGCAHSRAGGALDEFHGWANAIELG
jgi:hypothetical protein